MFLSHLGVLPEGVCGGGGGVHSLNQYILSRDICCSQDGLSHQSCQMLRGGIK